jgi:hypothetical protein
MSMKQSGEYLPDSVLLIGLKKANITIQQLIEANCDNLNPNARILPEQSYKDS